MAPSGTRCSYRVGSELGGERFAILPAPARVWAVGPSYGQAARLGAAHRWLAERLAVGDRVVYLGNYLGFGDQIIATVDEILAFRRHLLARPRGHLCDVVHLRGAQEEMWRKLLQLHLALDPVRVLEWMLRRGVWATLDAYHSGTAASAVARARGGATALARWTTELRQRLLAHPGHDPFLAGLRHAAVTADGALLLVHAGVDPARPLSAQSDTLWWGSPAFERLDGPYEGFARVVCGFDPAHRGVRVDAYSATLDGGPPQAASVVVAAFAADGELLETTTV